MMVGKSRAVTAVLGVVEGSKRGVETSWWRSGALSGKRKTVTLSKNKELLFRQG